MKEEKKKERENVEEKAVGEIPHLSELSMLLQQHILKQEAVWVFMKAAHEWFTQGFVETILPPPIFPDWVLPYVGPSGHAHAKPDVATPDEAKSTAEPKKTIELDSDEEDVPLNFEQQGGAQNADEECQSVHASDNGGEVSGNESAAAERERKSKFDAEMKKAAAAKGNATTASPSGKNEKTPAVAVQEPIPSYLAPRSTWTRKKTCVSRPPRWKRLKRMREERMQAQEEEEEEGEDIQVPIEHLSKYAPPAKKKK